MVYSFLYAVFLKALRFLYGVLMLIVFCFFPPSALFNYSCVNVDAMTDFDFIRTVQKATNIVLDRDIEYVDGDGLRKLKKLRSNYAGLKVDDNAFDCCRVERNFVGNSIYGFLMGEAAVTVFLKNHSSKSRDGDYRYVFNTCGRLMDSDVGLPDTYQKLVVVKRDLKEGDLK